MLSTTRLSTRFFTLNMMNRVMYRPIHNNNMKILRGYGTDTTQLFNSISELDKYGLKLKSFPTLVTIGPQSSGKSSVLEAVCGKDLLPKGMGMATLKPIHLTTIKSKDAAFKINNKIFTSEKDAQNELTRLNNNPHVKNIKVTVSSPEVYNSFMIDLPGLFFVSKDDPELPKKVKHLAEQHLEDEQNIPIVVSAAPTDPATNQALQLVHEYKRSDDTFGIITKTDLTKNQNTNIIEEMLQGNRYQLGHGYCALVLRNTNDVNTGKTIKDKIVEEKKYFDGKPKFRPCGVETMRRKISEIQYDKIKHNIPSLLDNIDHEIGVLEKSQNFLTNLINDPNQRLSNRLKLIIEKLVGSSLERAEFEQELKKKLRTEIHSFIEHEFKDKKFEPKYSNRIIEKPILAYNTAMKTNVKDFEYDGFKELFSFGLRSPILINSDTINKAVEKEMKLALSCPLFDIIENDPMGKKKLSWNRYLNRYFQNLLVDDNIENTVYEITETMILKYLHDTDHGEIDELTRKFSEYIVKEIGSEAYEEKMRFSMRSLINLEKRPHISLNEMIRELSQLYKEKLIFKGGIMEFFRGNKQKIEVEIYGEEWNYAYLRVVAEKLTENFYRNVAVNLLDQMVEKLLEMTIDMFNKENAMKEKNRVTDKINQLQELKENISKFV